MPQPPETIPDAKIVGRALANLRVRAGLTQTEAGERYGVTYQAWQRYEAGLRQNVLRSDLQAKLARAVNATVADLEREQSRVLAGDLSDQPFPEPEAHPPAGLHEPPSHFALPIARAHPGQGAPGLSDEVTHGRQFDLFQLVGPNSGVLEMASEDMLPWSEPGEIIIYDRGRYPRRGYGCVVETNTDGLHVKFYNRVEDGKLYVDQLNPAETISFDIKDVKGVYAVRLRGD